jgi:hypothetical protein
MPKKNKTAASGSAVAPKKSAGDKPRLAKSEGRAKDKPGAVRKAAEKKAAVKKPLTKKAAVKKAAVKKAASAKRAASRLILAMPLARARKLAGDLYEAAGLALWADAIETAPEPKKSDLIALQDAICDAADFLREARATNPKHLQLFMIACIDRKGVPATAPRFVTAAGEEEALEIAREAFRSEFGRRRLHAFAVPSLAAAPGPHE